MASSPSRTCYVRSMQIRCLNICKDCFGVDADTNTRDACAPQNRHASSRELVGVLVPQPIINYGSLTGAAAVWDVVSVLG
jgi:hypothetical protein